MMGDRTKKVFTKNMTALTIASRSFVLVLLFMSSQSSHAQTDPSAGTGAVGDEMMLFQEIPSVYGASKYEQKVTEAPSSVSIVTAAEIRKYGYRTLADILRSVRGFYVTYDRNYSYAGVRGFNRPGDYNSRILLLLDGHRTNDNIYDQAFIGTDFILDVDLIDRVEIIRGPSSSLYGSNAFFGVINVITKRGRDLKGAEISGEAAAYRTDKERLSYGQRLENGVEVIASGSRYVSDGPRNLFYGEFYSPATNYGVAHNVDDDQARSFFVKTAFSHFTVTAARVSREKGVPTAAYETVFNDPHTRTTDTRSFVDLKYAQSFIGQWDATARLSYDRYEFEGDYLFDYPPLTINRDESLGEWWGAEGQVSRKLDQQKITMGAEYQANAKQDQKNFDVAPYFLYLDDRRRPAKWALYAQDEITIRDDLIVNVGARYDHYESFGGNLHPRLALIYNPIEKASIKLLYGEAFRAPNAYELYYQDGGNTTKANPLLEPEEIKTYELIYEHYLGDHLRMTAGGFSYKIKDLITQQTDPADDLLVFRNVNRTKAYGLEGELEGRWAGGYEARAGATYQRAEDATTGMLLTNSPKYLAKLNVIVPLLRDRVFAGIEEQFTSSRRTLADRWAQEFWLTNLTLSVVNLPEGLELSASVYNLLDKRYGDPGSEEHTQDIIGQDGRNFRVKLTYRF